MTPLNVMLQMMSGGDLVAAPEVRSGATSGLSPANGEVPQTHVDDGWRMEEHGVVRRWCCGWVVPVTVDDGCSLPPRWDDILLDMVWSDVMDFGDVSCWYGDTSILHARVVDGEWLVERWNSPTVIQQLVWSQRSVDDGCSQPRRWDDMMMDVV